MASDCSNSHEFEVQLQLSREVAQTQLCYITKWHVTPSCTGLELGHSLSIFTLCFLAYLAGVLDTTKKSMILNMMDWDEKCGNKFSSCALDLVLWLSLYFHLLIPWPRTKVRNTHLFDCCMLHHGLQETGGGDFFGGCCI